MGLLDDLKKQAEARILQVPSAHDDEPQKHLHFQQVHAILLEASTYFGELAQSLNVVKPDVRRQFYLEGSTKLSNLLQANYTPRDRRRSIAGNDHLVEVGMHFICAGSGSLAFEKETRQANMMKEYLWAYSVPFENRDIRDDHGRIVRSAITVLSKIPSSVTLTGDWDTGQFELTLRNVELLGEVKQNFDGSLINHDFLEEIGKVVLAQPNDLRNFGRSADAPLPASFAPPRSA